MNLDLYEWRHPAANTFLLLLQNHTKMTLFGPFTIPVYFGSCNARLHSQVVPWDGGVAT
jgi:hypothetical protein